MTYKSFSNHLWFLSEALVNMAFFDDRVNLQEKRKMVEPLSSRLLGPCEKRPTIPKNKVPQAALDEFVSGNTKTFLGDFSFDTDFLELDPSEWEKTATT